MPRRTTEKKRLYEFFVNMMESSDDNCTEILKETVANAIKNLSTELKSNERTAVDNSADDLEQCVNNLFDKTVTLNCDETNDSEEHHNSNDETEEVDNTNQNETKYNLHKLSVHTNIFEVGFKNLDESKIGERRELQKSRVQRETEFYDEVFTAVDSIVNNFDEKLNAMEDSEFSDAKDYRMMYLQCQISHEM